MTIDILVSDRLQQAQLGLRLRGSGAECEDHVTRSRVDLEVARTVKCEADLIRIGVGSNDEVVFEPPLVAVIDQVSAGIDRAVANAAVIGNVSTPSTRVRT